MVSVAPQSKIHSEETRVLIRPRVLFMREVGCGNFWDVDPQEEGWVWWGILWVMWVGLMFRVWVGVFKSEKGEYSSPSRPSLSSVSVVFVSPVLPVPSFFFASWVWHHG